MDDKSGDYSLQVVYLAASIQGSKKNTENTAKQYASKKTKKNMAKTVAKCS